MPVTATLVPDRPAIRLSGSLTLQAALEGPAPLRVEVPAEVLSDESAPIWQIIPLGSAKLADLSGGTQRWSQDYKLVPFAPGDSVPLSLREFPVTSGDGVSAKSVAFPVLSIRVETSITKIEAAEARPITGIEQLPPLPPESSSSPVVIGVGIAAVVLFLTAMALVYRRPPVEAVAPSARAQREIDELPPGDGVPEKLSAILRGFAARHFDLPAETMTTAELKKQHPDDELTDLLEACDRAKFAGERWTVEETQARMDRAKAWVVSRTRKRRTPPDRRDVTDSDSDTVARASG